MTKQEERISKLGVKLKKMEADWVKAMRVTFKGYRKKNGQQKYIAMLEDLLAIAMVQWTLEIANKEK